MIGISTYKKVEAVKYKDLIVVNKRMNNYDPTHTTVLRNSFIKDIDRRFNLLLRDIRQAIIEDDVFGLKPVSHTLKVYSSPGKEAFKFTTSSDKVTKFMEWLKEQEKKGLLQTTTIQQLGVPIEKAWTDMYVQDSYKRGVQRARYEMGKAGMGTPDVEQTGGISASMSTPFHMDRVGVLYTRTFSDLKGITSTMDAAISRVLAQGIIDGENPRSLAKKITDATGIFRNRARTLARTEIIRAHHMGAVQEYRNWGLVGVKVQAEWSTAGYNVCPDCQSMEGKIFTLDEIEGMIPRHPNCRCMALPTMPDKTIKEVETVEKVIDIKIPEKGDKVDKTYFQVIDILKEKNLKVNKGSDSLTNYGHSRYMYVNDFKGSSKDNIGMGLKVRVSDHSVVNTGRVINEIHIPAGKDFSLTVKQLEYYFYPSLFKEVETVKKVVSIIEVPKNQLRDMDKIISSRTSKKRIDELIYKIERTINYPAYNIIDLRDNAIIYENIQK